MRFDGVRFDEQRRLPVTAAEMGLFLNMTSGAVRKVIAMHNIQPVGKRGRAHLYWGHEVFDAAGGNVERTYRPRRTESGTVRSNRGTRVSADR